MGLVISCLGLCGERAAQPLQNLIVGTTPEGGGEEEGERDEWEEREERDEG